MQRLNTRTSPRSAFTLVEAVMASAIFVTAVAMVMQGLVASQELTAMGSAQDELAFDSKRVLRMMSADMSLSGWDGTTGGSDTFLGDRNDHYFPYVMQQVTTDTGGNLLDQGLGSQFVHAQRNGNMVELNLPEALRGQVDDAHTNFDETNAAEQARYLDSYHARSQELIFLRIATEPWSTTPTPTTQLMDRFIEGDWTDTSTANREALGILHPSAWEETALDSGAFDLRPALVDGSIAGGTTPIPYGHIIHGGRLRINGGDISLDPSWETIDAPDYTGVIPDEWREYQYAVIPSTLGLGRLVRAVKTRVASVPGAKMGTDVGDFITPIISTTFAMRINDVLSDNVARIVFNTFRTDDSLEINQVAVRIYFARRSLMKQDLILTKVVDTVFAMRTMNSESDVSRIQEWISTSVGFDY